MKTGVLGLQFDNVTMNEALSRARELLRGDHAAMVVTPNAEIAYEALKSEELRALLNSADLMLPDGSGVVLAAKILKTPLRQKVAGVDFADGLLGVLEQNVCGIADGYFKDEAAVVKQINAAAPDVLFVCLGAPKQERFMQAHRAELNVRLMAGLGGSLDSFAGTLKRAPCWMIRMNLEWLYRLIRQPSRFGRMLRLPKYIWAAACERVRGTKKWEN